MQFLYTVLRLKHQIKCYGVGRSTEIMWDMDIGRSKKENCATKKNTVSYYYGNHTYRRYQPIMWFGSGTHESRMPAKLLNNSPEYDELKSWEGGTRWMELDLNLVKWRNLVPALLKQQTILPESFTVETLWSVNAIKNCCNKILQAHQVHPLPIGYATSPLQYSTFKNLNFLEKVLVGKVMVGLPLKTFNSLECRKG
jgi:hypothetical protein